MIALVVFACLASQPATCSHQVVRWADQPETLNCAAEISAPVSDWAQAHPDMQVKGHWCMTDLGQTLDASGLQSVRVTPLSPCDVRDRATGRMWSNRNPGVSAVAECKRLISN